MSWEEVAQKNHKNKAVTTDYIDIGNRRVKADLIKPLQGDGVWCYANTAFKIRKATAAEVDDKSRRWRDY